jgi:hypothetical protein
MCSASNHAAELLDPFTTLLSGSCVFQQEKYSDFISQRRAFQTSLRREDLPTYGDVTEFSRHGSSQIEE